ncbi:unnamed protein product [Bursaphelenchus xylophilus]|uniref:(pine wood nematode) hypothetical protein n=1 Tax=Bursaphelenchus xylophilus TaxID=6326 RepID=A0A1I7S0K7_BURXY|nr:unnamed protein product [Bursaphelenchus xylophilus]CAG9132314.1 unnamed protein product [Bursaphelenchus xylophilus]
MSARYFDGTETEPSERISAHSSEDAGESGSVPLDGSPLVLDEHSRLERKIAKVREKITWNTIAREGDVEEYLRITNGVENVADNPQLARIRQHFEKKNKKYSQEADQLQKKLDELERKLEEVDNGTDVGKPGHHRMFHNVGHGIKKTGVNLREMTGNVINAPLDIAQKVKRNVFGSADNIPAAVTENAGSNVGQSIFYENGYQPQSTASLTEAEPKKSVQTPIRNEIEPSNRLSIHYDENEINLRLMKEVEHLKTQNSSLKHQLENLKKESENEVKTLRMDLIASNYKITKLEQSLNETMDLHQNEVKQLKNDLNLIGTRMDYQYNDRFKKIEEGIENAQNRMYRMETNWHENSEKLLGAGQNMWNAVMLSFANIVVEVLKIILYVVAVVLDSIKPFTGTRRRAGFVLLGILSLFILWNLFGPRTAPIRPPISTTSETQPS